MSEELTRRERNKAKFKTKFQSALAGLFGGPLLMIGGQTIVNGWDLHLVAGWTLTFMGIIILLVSGGLAIHYWIEIDESR